MLLFNIMRCGIWQYKKCTCHFKNFIKEKSTKTTIVNVNIISENGSKDIVISCKMV